MSLYQLFTRHSWWGKLIGAFFGFLIAGPAGALFGIIIGNFFDRGLKLHLSHPFLHYHSEKNPEIRRIFLETTFATLGRLAKADGHVSMFDIEYANEIMAQMKLDTHQIALAQHWFSQGKSIQFQLDQKIHTMYKLLHHKPFLVRLFVDTQYRYVKQTQLTERRMAILNRVLAQLQLAPLYQHAAFARDFPWYYTWQQHTHQQHSQQNQQQYRSHQPPPRHHPSIEDPYAILNVKPTASFAEVKRAYRRQISHHHPDKLIAKGASSSHIKAATEKTQKIRKAYEDICQSRGW